MSLRKHFIISTELFYFGMPLLLFIYLHLSALPRDQLLLETLILVISSFDSNSTCSLEQFC